MKPFRNGRQVMINISKFLHTIGRMRVMHGGLLHRFLCQRASTALRAMADRFAADRDAARAFPPLEAPRLDRATA